MKITIPMPIVMLTVFALSTGWIFLLTMVVTYRRRWMDLLRCQWVHLPAQSDSTAGVVCYVYSAEGRLAAAVKCNSRMIGHGLIEGGLTMRDKSTSAVAGIAIPPGGRVELRHGPDSMRLADA